MTVANAWQEGLEQALATLAQMPHRHPVAPEADVLGAPSAHRLLYRRTRGGSAYHVLYRIFGPADVPLDAPFVRVIAVRHASMAPLTQDEAQQIEAAEE